MQPTSLPWWPLRSLLISIHWLFTLIAALAHLVLRAISMGDMLIDSIMMMIHPTLHLRRPQPSILPPELWNLILSQCHDRSTLLACSLVCSAWTSISREHLHLKTLSLDARARTARLGRLLRSPVQTLTHTANCASFSGQDYWQHWRVVRLLHLRGVNIRSALLTGDARAVPLLIRYFPDIVDLSFECNAVSSVLSGQVNPAKELNKLLSNISAFKSLRSLSINFDCVEYPTINDSECLDSLPITRLYIYGRWSRQFGSWVHKTCRQLETLVLLAHSGWDSKDTVSVDSILRANAETLRHLQLTVPGTLNLSVVKDLRSLLLKLKDDSNASFANVISTLHSIGPLRSPRDVRIQRANPRSSFSGEQIAAVEKVKTKLDLLLDKNQHYTLSFVNVEVSV